MTTFQPIFDRATSISINKSRKVSQTVSRDGVVRATSLGGQTWQFNVSFPNNQPYSTMRGIIEDIENVGRISSSTVAISASGHQWITGYQGDLSDLANLYAYANGGNTIELTSGSGGLTAGQYKFRSGDYIQLGNGAVYTVVYDVAHNEDTVTLHRPLRDSAGSYALSVGSSVNWNVVCVSLPQWTLNQKNLVSWDGDFVFAEVV